VVAPFPIERIAEITREIEALAARDEKRGRKCAPNPFVFQACRTACCRSCGSMRECLRNISDLPPRVRFVLFRQQADIVAQ